MAELVEPQHKAVTLPSWSSAFLLFSVQLTVISPTLDTWLCGFSGNLLRTLKECKVTNTLSLNEPPSLHKSDPGAGSLTVALVSGCLHLCAPRLLSWARRSRGWWIRGIISRQPHTESKCSLWATVLWHFLYSCQIWESAQMSDHWSLVHSCKTHTHIHIHLVLTILAPPFLLLAVFKFKLISSHMEQILWCSISKQNNWLKKDYTYSMYKISRHVRDLYNSI